MRIRDLVSVPELIGHLESIHGSAAWAEIACRLTWTDHPDDDAFLREALGRLKPDLPAGYRITPREMAEAIMETSFDPVARIALRVAECAYERNQPEFSWWVDVYGVLKDHVIVSERSG